MSDFLKNFFDAAYLINLKRRRDRLVRFHRRFEEIGGWPFCDLKVIEAIDGSMLPPPVGYKSGHGAWGCKQSHILIHQDALMNEYKRVLIFEDDAEFREGFVEDIEKFLKDVPKDWEALMLGGQNMKDPELIEGMPSVVRCTNTQRTHALAFKPQALKDILRMYYSCDVHIDWRLGPFLGSRKKTYAPSPFLVGQSSSKSDITLNRNTSKFWNTPSATTPVVLLVSPQNVAEFCRVHGCHYGAHLDQHGRDVGLNLLFPEMGKYEGNADNFLSMMRWEADSFPEAPAIPTIWHPNFTKATALAVSGELSRTECIVVEAKTTEEAQEQITKNEILKEYFFERSRGTRKPVVVLQVPQEVAERLSDEHVVHTGWWKNESGIDVGLEARFWASWQSGGEVNLRDWYATVYLEADHLNALVGLWHPQMTEEIAKSTGEKVVVIQADTYEDALEQADAAIP